MARASPTSPVNSSASPTCNTVITESYEYSVPGAITKKRIRVIRTVAWGASDTLKTSCFPKTKYSGKSMTFSRYIRNIMKDCRDHRASK